MILLAFLSLYGCMGEMALDGSNAFEVGELPPAEAQSAIRVDILPAADTGLLPQSFIYTEQGWQDSFLSISLAATANLPGQIHGEVTMGWGADAPSKTSPLDAVITAADPGSIAYGLAQSEADTDGAFTLSVPQGIGYYMAVVPDDPSSSPVWASANTALLAGNRLDIDLPVGAPIFGRLTDEDGNPLAGAPLKLYAVDSPVPLSSSTFTTDESGWYTIRVAQSGPWRLETIPGRVPNENYLLPRLSAEITLESSKDELDTGDTGLIEAGTEGIYGTTLNLEAGRLSSSGIGGSVVDSDGKPVADAQVLVSSRSLDTAAGSYDAETTTSGEGTFFLEAIPGVYELTIIPPYDSPLTPSSSLFAIGKSLASAGTIRLEGLSTLKGQVEASLDDDTQPMSGVTVTATQTAFGGYSYTGVTAGDGSYNLKIPSGNYLLNFTPPDPSSWAITSAEQSTGSTQTFSLAAGSEVQGQLLGSGDILPFAVVEIHSAADGRLLARSLSDASGNFFVRIDLADEEQDTGAEDADSGDSGDTGADSGDSGQ